MKITQETLTVGTRGRDFHDLTASVRAIVTKSGVRMGLCTVFVQHTSASLLIQENADPSVLRDLGRWLAKLAPEDSSAYEHDAEGPDDMPSHLKTSMTRASEFGPDRGGEARARHMAGDLPPRAPGRPAREAGDRARGGDLRGGLYNRLAGPKDDADDCCRRTRS